MAENIEEKENRGRRYIRILNEDNWAFIDRLMALKKYKSFNKVVNDALDYGLPELLKAEYGEVDELNESAYDLPFYTTTENQENDLSVRLLEEIINLLEEVVLNTNISKSVLSSMLNSRVAELYGKNVRADKLEQGIYCDTPSYLEAHERRISRRIKDKRRK